MYSDEMRQLGHRDRKKRATRNSLSWAALQLALERGLDNVRVDDIAAAAGVSTRTYNNYFSSRAEAICALGIEQAERVGAALLARPPSEEIGQAIVAAMVQEYTVGPEPDKKAIRLISLSPTLQGEYLKTTVAIERPLAEAIAERTGTDAERDLFPRILAAAVSSAGRVATEHWLRRDTTAPFATVLHEALAHVSAVASSGQPHPSQPNEAPC
jgi:AcrR family transcriptional regulator